MKKQIAFLAAFFVATAFLSAQEPEPYVFKEIKVNEATPVKSQDMTGTCWSFSSASFLESELIRMGKGQQDLSEMYVVRHIYRAKAENYVRRQGNARLSEGGLAHDLLNAVAQYGIVPQTVYPGTKDPGKPYNHAELEKNLISMCDEMVALGKKGKLPANWLKSIDSFLDAEFGVVPKTFAIGEKPYTPKQFCVEMGINPSDYVNITSFTHHPFGTEFILEIPDNFSNGSYYNVALEDLEKTITHAIMNGHTMVWDGDVSNTGFVAKYGMAIVPAVDWADKNEVQKKNSFKYYEKEENVDQALRQRNFDSQETTDDHLMHLTGIVRESHGNRFFVIKNSWGEISDLKGFLYASDAYIRMNTVAITLHKDAIPKDVAARMGLMQDFHDRKETKPNHLKHKLEQKEERPGQ